MTIVQNPKSPLILKNSKILEDINEGVKDVLIQKGQIFTLTSKKSYLKELPVENKVYLLVQGRAFLSCIESDGRKIIMENLHEGSFFGDLDFEQNGEVSQTPEAKKLAVPPIETCSVFLEPLPKEEIEIISFSKEDFLEVLTTSPALMLKVLSNTAQRANQLEQKLEELAFFGLETKILVELIKLGDLEQGEENVIKIKSKITHEKLAQSTGSVRETVSRAVSKLKRTGFIFYDRQKNLIVRLFKVRSLS